MTTSRELMARKRLQWVEHARKGILDAIGDDVVDPTFQVFPTIDALRFILKISLRLPIGKDTRDPLRRYLRAWAKEFDCDITVINIQSNYVQAEVLTKTRAWSRDAKGQFTNSRFERKQNR